VDRLFFALPMEDRARLFGEPWPHVLEVLAHVMVEPDQKLFSLFCRKPDLRTFFRSGRLLLLFRFVSSIAQHGAGVGHLFHLGAAAGGARDQFLDRLLLKTFKARKPAFKAVILLANEVVNNHKSYLSSISSVVKGGLRGADGAILPSVLQDKLYEKHTPEADSSTMPLSRSICHTPRQS